MDLLLHEMVASSLQNEHDHEPGPGRDEALAMETNTGPPLPDQLEQQLVIEEPQALTNGSSNVGEMETANTPRSNRDMSSEPCSSTVEDDDVLSTGSSSGYSSSDDGKSSDLSTITILTTSPSTDATSTTTKLESSCRRGRGEGSILVLVGCRSCFKYFMVEKAVLECPGCGGGDGAGSLVRFGQ